MKLVPMQEGGCEGSEWGHKQGLCDVEQWRKRGASKATVGQEDQLYCLCLVFVL